MSSNFERLHEIKNEAYAENFSCLSHCKVRNPHPLYNPGTCWTSPFSLMKIFRIIFLFFKESFFFDQDMKLKTNTLRTIQIAMFKTALSETPKSLCLLLREDDRTAIIFFLVCSGFLSQLRFWSALNRVEHAKKLKLLKNKGLISETIS